MTDCSGRYFPGATELVAFTRARKRQASDEQPRYSLNMSATAYRYIVKKRGVRGGNAVVEGTRIGVHDVIGLLQNGETVDSSVRCFPDITRAQVYECLAYYEDHRGEIDVLVARQMAPADE